MYNKSKHILFLKYEIISDKRIYLHVNFSESIMDFGLKGTSSLTRYSDTEWRFKSVDTILNEDIMLKIKILIYYDSIILEH